MKFRLDPKLSYLIGLWHSSKYKIGIGVCGEASLLFADLCLKYKIAAPGKILYKGNCVYFYNSKLKKFFETVEKERKHRFVYFNDYSASYFAGMFDGNGGRDQRGFFIKGDDVDEWLLNVLHFPTERRARKIYPLKQIAFIKFIYDYVLLRKGLLNEFI